MNKTIEELEAENTSLRARIEEMEAIALSPEENRILYGYQQHNIGADSPEFEVIMKKLMNFSIAKEPK